MLAALMLGVAFPIVAIFIREADSHAGPLTDGDSALPGLTLGESTRSASFWLLAIPVLLVVTAINGIVAHPVPLLTDRGLPIAQARSTLSAVGLSTIAGRLFSGYLLDRFFAPKVAAALFLLPLAGVGILAAGTGGTALVLAAIALGFGLGAEVDVIGFMVSRYFGLRSYGAIYRCMFAIFTVGTGLGPVLMGLSFDGTRSYTLALGVFSVALVCASGLVSRLGRYNFPARHQVWAVDSAPLTGFSASTSAFRIAGPDALSRGHVNAGRPTSRASAEIHLRGCLFDKSLAGSFGITRNAMR